MPLSEPLSLRTYSRVKVSGWNQDEVFFVEKSELGNDEFTGKHISLEHMLADGAIIFVRVLQPTSSHRNSSIAYEKYNDAYGKTIASLTRRAQTLLLQHHWPGNARELENVISTACITAMGDFIDISDLPEHLQHRNSSLAGDEDRHPLSLDEVRKHHIQKVPASRANSGHRPHQPLSLSECDGLDTPRMCTPPAPPPESPYESGALWLFRLVFRSTIRRRGIFFKWLDGLRGANLFFRLEGDHGLRRAF